MAKKILLILLIVITVGLLTYVFISAKKKQSEEKINSPVVEEKSSGSTLDQTKKSVKLLTYNDPAGFSFSYPENVQVAPVEAADNNVYSSLTLTTKEKQGNISVEVVTSNLQKIDDWFKNKPKSSKKLKLAELDARQFEEEGKLTTIALDPGVLFTITVDYKTEKDFWSAVNNKVIASFAFVAPESQNVSNNSSGEDIIFEGEEEVIE